MIQGVEDWSGHRQVKGPYSIHREILDSPLAALVRDLKVRGFRRCWHEKSPGVHDQRGLENSSDRPGLAASSSHQAEAGQREKAERSGLRNRGDPIIPNELDGRLVERFIPDGNIIDVTTEEEAVSVVGPGTDVEILELNCPVGRVLGCRCLGACERAVDPN